MEDVLFHSISEQGMIFHFKDFAVMSHVNYN